LNAFIKNSGSKKSGETFDHGIYYTAIFKYNFTSSTLLVGECYATYLSERTPTSAKRVLRI